MGYSGKEEGKQEKKWIGVKKGTFYVEIKPEPKGQGSRNPDLQLKSKADQSSCKYSLSQGSRLSLARNRL